MIHLQDIYELKARIHQLKLQLDREPKSWQEKDLAQRYLTSVLDIVDEISSF